MTTQEIVKVLKCCTDLTSPYVCERCPIRHGSLTDCNSLRRQAADLIESLTAELEQVKQERDAWKLRAEAAEHDFETLFMQVAWMKFRDEAEKERRNRCP